MQRLKVLKKSLRDVLWKEATHRSSRDVVIVIMVEINPQLRRYHSTGGRLTRIFRLSRLRVAYLARETRRTRILLYFWIILLKLTLLSSRRKPQARSNKKNGLKGQYQVSTNWAFEKIGQKFQVCKTCFDIPMSSSVVDISYNYLQVKVT